MKLKLIVLAVAAALSASVFAAESSKDKASTAQTPSASGSSAQGSSAQRPSAAPGSSAQGASGSKAQGSSAQGSSAPRSSAEGASKQAGASGAQGMSGDTVKKAQQALKDKGHDPGPIDGQYGPLTQKGVKEFQEKQNMKATGRLDQQTLSALGVQEGSSAVGAGADKKDTKKKKDKKEEGKDKK
jgi:peptidoglycan hydrolase-like protein with peptidoglycan-binding domain